MTDLAPHAPVSRETAGPSRRRWVSVLLWFIVILSLVVVGGSYLSVLLPVVTLWAWVWSILATGYSLYFFIPAALCLAVAVAARRRRRALAIVAAVTAVLSAVAFAAPWVVSARYAASEDVQLSAIAYVTDGLGSPGPDETLVYATVDGAPLELQVWHPTSPAAHGGAIVYVHGGGYTGGGLNQRPHLMSWYSQLGYTVFDIEYRLEPQPLWREATRDVKCAIGWVAEHASEYGIDADEIVVSGNSAGGNLALLAAYTAGTESFPPSCDVAEQPVSAVIASYAPTESTDHTSGVPALSEGTNPYFGGTQAEVPEAYLATSPVHHVRPGLPPTLLLQGANDHLIAADQARALDRLLRETGNCTRLAVLPYADHLYDRIPGSWANQIANGVSEQFLDDTRHRCS